MGNRQTHVGLVIQTEKPFYLPGEMVRGYVYVNSAKPYPATSILLHIQGLEKNWWKVDTQVNNKPSMVTVDSTSSANSVNRQQLKLKLGGDRNAQCKILSADFTMSTWNKESFLHGQYAFPFEFVLPSYIPGSFKEETPVYKANISYTIKCTVVSPKKEFPSIETTQEIIVRENRRTIQEHLYGETYIYPQTCCCLKKGVCKVCCYFQINSLKIVENQYLPGEDCIAICEVDNYKSSASFREVNLKFLKCVTVVSGFGEERSFTQVVRSASFPGIGPHGIYTGENAQRLALPLKYRESDRAIHPSTSGRYVKCEYHIQVSPVLSGCCTSKSETFAVRLNILQEGLIEEKIEEPADWKPDVYATSEILLNTQPMENEKLNEMTENYM